jgi:uncharacterized protein DUF4157
MPENYQTNSTNTYSGLLKLSSDFLRRSDPKKSGITHRLLIKFSNLQIHPRYKRSKVKDDKKSGDDINNVKNHKHSDDSSRKSSLDTLFLYPTALGTFRQVLPLTTRGKDDPLVSRHNDLVKAIVIHSKRADPGAIKIHTGFLAEQITTLYNADALTIGKNIFFSAGKLDLASPRGLALFAHELSHINQQESDTDLQKGYVGPSKYVSLEKEAQVNEQYALEYFTSATNYKQHSKNPLDRGRTIPLIGSFPNIDFITHSYIPTVLLRPSIHPGVKEKKTEIGFVKSDSHQHLTEKKNELGIQYYNSDRITKHVPSNDFTLQNSTGMPEGQQSGISNLVFADSPKQVPSESLSSVPFTAERGRPVESKAAASPITSMMPSSARSSPTLDLNRLAEQVYEIIERKIKMQRDRTGLR